MSTLEAVAPPSVRWDLSALFSGLDDPRIDESWAAVTKRVDEFVTRYKGRINTADLDAATLAAAIQEIEFISREAAKPQEFAELVFAADSSDTANGAFLQRQSELATQLGVKLLFFELELQALPQETIDRLIADTSLANYRHFIAVTRAFSRYRLSEAEEVILEETSNTGIRAWHRLFEEVTSNHVFRVELPDGTVECSQSEVLAYLRNPDREIRQRAADGFTAGLTELKRVLGLTFNNILLDKSIKDRLRSHPYPEHSRHLSNELDKQIVDLVVRLCSDHYTLVSRFYRVKREILGLPELTHIDRYAPLFETKEQVEWERARLIVLEAFGAFSPELSRRAGEFFDEQWIDAEPRKGKGGGAFCSYVTPDLHPFIFQSYLNKMDDVMTLAHELGHGVHASLSRGQTYFNFHGTLPLAELASTFGEMLVFERLVEEASPQDRLALYAEKIEGVFATVFRQAAMFGFEQKCHEARRAEGELSWDRVGDIWQASLQEMFGDSVKLGEQHRCWWSYIGHFVRVPFYVYAYSFGELLALSLYQMAKREGRAFESRYLDMLKMGGSKSPIELMQSVDVDLTDERFWLGGFDAMTRLIEQFESLWGDMRSS